MTRENKKLCMYEEKFLWKISSLCDCEEYLNSFYVDYIRQKKIDGIFVLKKHKNVSRLSKLFKFTQIFQ